ncbi:hypothetical protein [Streptomyces sp. NPDC058665]|uniref:hypothetical protein n=1 Tax=Streptomyces sp. NPDC058665 TaxID=3346586 RepID=UPI003667A495
MQELATMLFGYSVALQVHALDEEFDTFRSCGPFARWLNRKYRWSTVRGWASAIEQNLPDEPPLEAFFRLFDEFRESRDGQEAGIGAS